MEDSANGTMTCYPSIKSHQFPWCQYIYIYIHIFADFSRTPILKHEQIVFDSGRIPANSQPTFPRSPHPHILQHGSASLNEQTTKRYIHELIVPNLPTLCFPCVFPKKTHHPWPWAKVQGTSSRCLVPKSGHWARLKGGKEGWSLEGLRESVAHSQASWNVAWLFFDLHKFRVWRIVIPWMIVVMLLLGWPKLLFKYPQVSKLWFWISHTIR